MVGAREDRTRSNYRDEQVIIAEVARAGRRCAERAGIA
jgi:hypothetical protein